jgi:proline dehydrogenase
MYFGGEVSVSFANTFIVSALQRVPKTLVRPVAMRYIAGETLGDAVRVVQDLNARKMMATIDVLGEDVSTKDESLLAVQACEEVLREVRTEGLNANLSIKLTQFGIKIDESFGYENVKRILNLALEYKNFIRIDMEDSSLTTTTLKSYERLRQGGFENVGIVIQAYLRRSEEDVKKLVLNRANVRLVKGIYVEPESIAFKGRQEVRDNFLKILRTLLERGCYTAIATHDDYLLDGASHFIQEMNLPNSAYEFQMLYGVMPSLRDEIVRRGHRMRIYVPFGEHWYPYSMRRFQENPQMARYVLQALFFRQ